MSDLEQLPGTPYSRYALPLEYPPSRELRPRWGYSKPPIEPIRSWLAEHAPTYRSFLATMKKFGAELRDLPPALWNAPMNPIDLLTLYSFVRRHRPSVYLEIGSGSTTRFAHLARQTGNLATRVISIDPEPRSDIDAICDQVIRVGLETCDLAIFDQLNAGDILFLDGSHRCFMNSDVTVFFIDVLPRLKPGVIVHLHDIALPYDYHEYFTHWYWSEQYMLAVYLMGNRSRIAPLLPACFVSRDPMFAGDIAALAGACPHHTKEGGSMWFTHLN